MWMVTGSLAILFVLLNLLTASTSKGNKWAVMIFLSLSCGCATVMSWYNMAAQWVLAGDFSALLDVLPATNTALLIIGSVVIALNLIVLVIKLRKPKVVIADEVQTTEEVQLTEETKDVTQGEII